VGCPQLAGYLQLFIADIDGDDLRCTESTGDLDDVQSDSPQVQHSNALSACNSAACRTAP
jgi:hypothetical protein